MVKQRKYSILKHINRKTSNRTICDVHRQMLKRINSYDLSEEQSEEIFELIDEAYDMAKRMNDKLVYYHDLVNSNKKTKWHDNFFGRK